MRREISPSVITTGQVAQIQLKLRLLKQENGTFTLRELLKGVYVIDDGLSMVGGSRFTKFPWLMWAATGNFTRHCNGHHWQSS